MSKDRNKSFDLTDFNVVFPNKKRPHYLQSQDRGDSGRQRCSRHLQCWLGLAHC